MKEKRFVHGVGRALAALMLLMIGGSRAATAQYRFTTFDVPGATTTFLSGINNLGNILGEYTDGAGRHNFLFNGSEFLPLDLPESDWAFFNDLNDRSQVVGTALIRSIDPPGVIVGFVFDGSTNRAVEFPGAGSTGAQNINNQGMVVGSFGSGSVSTNGSYVFDGTSFTPIRYPGAAWTSADAINEGGQIAGTFRLGEGLFDGTSAFVFDGAGYRTVGQPAEQLSVHDMNNDGDIVGSYGTCFLCLSLDAPYLNGFVIENGTFTSISFPGAADTFVEGINDAGMLAGYYIDDDGTTHGFIATPIPEPATWLLISIPAAIVFFLKILRRQATGQRIPIFTGFRMVVSQWLLAGALVLIANVARAQLFTFTKVADNNTQIPGTTDVFRGFLPPVLDSGHLAFWGSGPGDRSGIYEGAIGGPFERAIDSTMLVPGSDQPVTLISHEFSLDMDRVVFGGWSKNTRGVYASENGIVTRIADTSMPIPSGTGNFYLLGVPSAWTPTADGGNVVFYGQGPSTSGVQPLRGVYLARDGALSRIVDTTMPLPGNDRGSNYFDTPVVDSGRIAFISDDPNSRGLYFHNLQTGILSVVVDTSTLVPGRAENFGAIRGSGRGLDVEGDFVAFIGEWRSGGGVFIADTASGVLTPVAEIGTSVPGGGPEVFGADFNSVSIDGGRVAFGYGTDFMYIPPRTGPRDSAIYGIFSNLGGSLAKVLDKGDVLDGKLVRQAHMSREGLDGNQIAMEVNFEAGTDAIYVATLIPEPATIVLLAVGCAISVFVARKKWRGSLMRKPDARFCCDG